MAFFARHGCVLCVSPSSVAVTACLRLRACKGRSLSSQFCRLKIRDWAALSIRPLVRTLLAASQLGGEAERSKERGCAQESGCGVLSFHSKPLPGELSLQKQHLRPNHLPLGPTSSRFPTSPRCHTGNHVSSTWTLEGTHPGRTQTMHLLHGPSVCRSQQRKPYV